MLTNVLAITAMFLYACAALAWLFGRVRPSPLRLARFGIGAQALSLVVGLQQGLGFVTSFASSLSTVVLLLVIVAAQMPGPRLDVVRGGLAVTAVFGLLASLLVPDSEISALAQVGPSIWLPLHLAFVFVGLAALVVEFGLSVVELLARRRLKAKRLEGLGHLPSLDSVARLRLRALGTGVLTLAVGVLFGGVWAASTMDHASWLGDSKVWFTMLVWTWYAVALGVHRASHGHAKNAIWWSAIGVLALLFGFAGLDFLTGGFHAYGR